MCAASVLKNFIILRKGIYHLKHDPTTIAYYGTKMSNRKCTHV